jgi:hypothetical protein
MVTSVSVLVLRTRVKESNIEYCLEISIFNFLNVLKLFLILQNLTCALRALVSRALSLKHVAMKKIG